MRKHCGNCANHRKETNQFSDECGKCVIDILQNVEQTDPSHWKAKPQTNADRIRAMTDEELARGISDLWHGFVSKPWCDFRCQNCREGDDYRCEKCALEWLKQPVEEE